MDREMPHPPSRPAKVETGRSARPPLRPCAAPVPDPDALGFEGWPGTVRRAHPQRSRER